MYTAVNIFSMCIGLFLFGVRPAMSKMQKEKHRAQSFAEQTMTHLCIVYVCMGLCGLTKSKTWHLSPSANTLDVDRSSNTSHPLLAPHALYCGVLHLGSEVQRVMQREPRVGADSRVRPVLTDPVSSDIT